MRTKKITGRVVVGYVTISGKTKILNLESRYSKYKPLAVPIDDIDHVEKIVSGVIPGAEIVGTIDSMYVIEVPIGWKGGVNA